MCLVWNSGKRVTKLKDLMQNRLAEFVGMNSGGKQFKRAGIAIKNLPYICLFIVLMVTHQSVAVPRTNGGADKFKDFLESPSVIREMTCVQEWPGFSHTNLFFLRWQHGAFLLGETAYSSPSFPPLLEDQTISSVYSNQYWLRLPNSLYNWTDVGNPVDKMPRNQAWYSANIAEQSISILILGGCGFLEPGQIHWLEDTFVCTNERTRVEYAGRLARDGSDRAQSLAVTYKGLDDTNANVKGQWVFSYSYVDSESNLPVFYPSSIHGVNKDSSSHQEVSFNETFYSFSTSSTPLPKELFALDRDDFKNADFAFQTTNGTLVVSNRVGPNIIGAEPPVYFQTLGRHRRPIIIGILIFIALCALAPLLVRLKR